MAPSLVVWLALSAAATVVLTYASPQALVAQSRAVTTICIFVLIVFLQIVYWSVLYPRFFTPFKSLPSRSLIGQPVSRRNIEDFFVDFARTAPRHNGVLRSYMPHAREMLIVLSPEGLADILVRKPYDFVKPDHIKFDLSFLFARGLFTAEGDEHKRLRKNLAPAFAFRHIKGLYPLFWTKSLQTAAAMARHVRQFPGSGGVVVMHDWTTRATLDIIGAAGIGFDFGSIDNPDNKLHQTYKRMTSQSRAPIAPLAIARSLGLETIFRFGLRLPSKEKEERVRALETVRGVARQMVDRHEKNENPNTDIIAVAMRSGAFSPEDLVDETMTFMGAGHESTSAAFLWGVYALCKYQHVQKRLREEVRSNVDFDTLLAQQQSGLDETSSVMIAATEKVEGLPYLNAFCNEVLRFYPSVPVTLRRSIRETSVAGIRIPPDTAFALPIRAINRDPALWGPDAAAFEPERWLHPGMAGSGGAASNYANMTFLHGPRSCIGLTFARGELLFLLAALAGKFEMALEEEGREPECVLHITILPKDGLRVRLTPLVDG